MGIIDDIFSSSNPAKYKAGSYANPGQPAPQQGGGLLDYFDEPGRMQTISSALMGAGQGMLQAPQNGGRFGQAMSGLAGMAGGMAQNKKKVEQEAMFEQLAGGDPLKLAFLKSNPEVGMKMMMEQKFAKPTATFSTVQNPYKQGGYGQKNSLTGEIINYQGAPKAAKQGNPIEVLDIASGKNVMIRPNNFDPTKHGSPKDAVKVGNYAQQAKDAGLMPGTPEFYAYVKELQKKTPLIENKSETAAQARLSGRRGALMDKYDGIASTRDKAAAMGRLAASSPTGYGAEWRLLAGRVGNAIGLPVDMKEITSLEQFNVLQMDFVMDRIAGTKGSISEKEMDAFKAAGPSLGNSREGNIIIAKVMGEQARRAEVLLDAELDALDSGMTEREARKEVGKLRAEFRKTDFLSAEEMATILGTSSSPVVEFDKQLEDDLNLYAPIGAK